MNRTTRILLVGVALVIASYPGLAWLTGVLIEHRIEHGEQALSPETPYLTVVKRVYRRGVYHSTELVTYRIRLPLSPALRPGQAARPLPTSMTLTVRNEITHGPFPGLGAPALAIIDSTLVLPAAAQRELSKRIGSQPIVRAHTRIGWFAGTRSTVTSPAFDWRGADGSTFAWQGLRAVLRGRRDMSSWSARASIPGLSVHSADGNHFELRNLTFSGRAMTVFGSMLVGRNRLDVGRLEGTDPGTGAAYALRHVRFTSRTDVHGAFLDMAFELSSDAVRFGKVSLSHVVYAASLEHLHGPTLARLSRALRAAEGQASADPALLQTRVQQLMARYGATLLLHDPVFAVRRVSFTMPEGTLRLTARASAPGLTAADLGRTTFVPALASHGRITADLSIDEPLLQSLMAARGSATATAARIAALEREGYLSARASALTLHLRYAGGRLMLNGQPFPPAAAAD